MFKRRMEVAQYAKMLSNGDSHHKRKKIGYEIQVVQE
jgi:hypothetical protein